MSEELRNNILAAVKKSMPDSTGDQIYIAYLNMMLRFAEMGIDRFDSDRNILEVYEQYKMWKILTQEETNDDR